MERMHCRAWQPQVLLMLLAGGAIVNVAVAWGCCWLINRSSENSRGITAATASQHWIDYSMPTEPAVNGWVEQYLGSRVTFVYAVREGDHQRNRATLACWLAIPPSLYPPLQVMECGFPAYSMRGAMDHMRGYSHAICTPPSTQPDIYSARRFPLNPMWQGFAINTIFYAAILWVVFTLFSAARNHSRLSRGLCPTCAYPIGTWPVCTECGNGASRVLAEVIRDE